jgi:hypothetical protein
MPEWGSRRRRTLILIWTRQKTYSTLPMKSSKRMFLLLLRTPRGRTPGWRVALVIAALLGTFFTHASATEPSYAGHYELARAKTGRVFSLDIKQKGSRADVSFSAAMADGSGAAPEGSGKGEVEDGILSFDFKDSFENEGTCTLEVKKDGYHLSMTVIKVVETGPLHFYGNVLLKKVSSHPQ